MRFLGRRCRRRLTILLAVWMTVVSLGISVTHAHECGGSPHVHGFGWTRAPADIADRLRSATGSGHPDELHRHLLLLGWELPGDTLPDAVQPEAVSVQPVAGLPADRSAEAAAGPGLTPPLLLWASPASPSCATRWPARPVVALCCFAHHAAAGLLRC